MYRRLTAKATTSTTTTTTLQVQPLLLLSNISQNVRNVFLTTKRQQQQEQLQQQQPSTSKHIIVQHTHPLNAHCYLFTPASAVVCTCRFAATNYRRKLHGEHIKFY